MVSKQCYEKYMSIKKRALNFHFIWHTKTHADGLNNKCEQKIFRIFRNEGTMAFYIFKQEILCKQQLEIRRLKTLEPDKRSLLSNG